MMVLDGSEVRKYRIIVAEVCCLFRLLQLVLFQAINDRDLWVVLCLNRACIVLRIPATGGSVSRVNIYH